MKTTLRIASRLLATAAAVLACASGCGSATSPTPPSADVPRPITPWSDEFDGPARSAPNPQVWTYDLGNNNGWGNNELQTYTSSPENVRLDGEGHLVIRVESTGSEFTSARLKTKGLVAAQYGRLEARIKVPAGPGIWPAFWMLGQTFDGSNWPQCGEIDVMEHIGREPFLVYGTVHGPGYSGARGISASRQLASRLADDFHVFAIDWSPGAIAFTIDGGVYHQVTPASLPPGAAWVFDQPFFVLLNVAVGGNFPGPPDATTRFPQEMQVDYVRYTPGAPLR